MATGLRLRVGRDPGPSCRSPFPTGTNSPAPKGSGAGLEGPEAPGVGVGRGKAANWFGAAGLSCSSRWPLPLSSCVTEECSFRQDKGSFVRRPREGAGEAAGGRRMARKGLLSFSLCTPLPAPPWLARSGLRSGQEAPMPCGHPHPLLCPPGTSWPLRASFPFF